jgi:DNA-binding GntR family transcriptional regulator
MTGSATPGPTDLTARLHVEMLRILRDEQPAVGTPLTERALATRLNVSRSPVRNALQRLHAHGYVSRTDSGRYVVARTGADIDATLPGLSDDDIYQRIADDRLDGVLPERVTEAALLQRYGLTRTRLAQMLMQMAQEGWIAPLPGYGWQFLPVLTSMESYSASYRFRLVIEPAMVLEPTFQLDRTAMLRRRAEQQGLVNGAIFEVSAAQLFDLNSRFHETIAVSSHNDFFLQALVRLNRLRRLIEYRQRLDPERAIIRCREHVVLADLLLEDQLDRASAFLHRHLATVTPEKTGEGAAGI